MNKLLKIGLSLQAIQWATILMVVVVYLLNKVNITKDVLFGFVLAVLIIGFNIFSIILIVKGVNQKEEKVLDYY